MVEKRKKRKIQQKQKQKQTVKQSVIINLQKRRASAPSAGKSQPSYRNAPPTIQLFPMPQYTPPSFNQELFNQKLETLKADILQKIPKEKISEKIPVPPLGVFAPDSDLESDVRQIRQPAGSANRPAAPFNPYREVPIPDRLNKPTDPIFIPPVPSSFQSGSADEDPENVRPVRRGRGRPVGSSNRPREVIQQEKDEKMLRRRIKSD